MTTIHMEPDKVLALVRKMDMLGAQMLANLGQTRSASTRLHFAWRGGDADDFNHDLHRLLKNLENQAITLQNLSTRVSRETDEWLSADQFGAGARPGPAWRQLPGIKQPQGWSPFEIGRHLLVGIGVVLIDGAHAMYGVAKDQFNRQVELGKDAVQKAVGRSDAFLDDGLTSLLGDPQAGESESIRLKVKGDVSIPGFEVGAPGSLKVEGAKEVTITKESGKYKLVLSNGGGVGIEEPLLPGGEAKLKLGKNTYGGSVDVSVEAMAKGEVEATYEFDPNRAGDMTKMAAFMYGIGVLDSTAGPLVAPALYTMKDNLVGIKMGSGGEVSAQANASALIKLAGVKSEVQLMGSGELRKVDGQWENIQHTELKLDREASVLTNQAGREMKASYETITHADGTQSVKVVVDVQSESGSKLKLDDLKTIAPSLKSMQTSKQEFEAVKLEFIVDAPLETAKKMIGTPGDGINWKALDENSSLVVHERCGTEMGLGASGKVQVPTQKIGIGVEADVVRESTREIYRS
jgi:uncharacterized protein YukE